MFCPGFADRKENKPPPKKMTYSKQTTPDKPASASANLSVGRGSSGGWTISIDWQWVSGYLKIWLFKNLAIFLNESIKQNQNALPLPDQKLQILFLQG